MDLFPSSAEGRETPTLLGPVECAKLSHWIAHVMDPGKEVSLSTHLKTEIDPVSETLCFLFTSIPAHCISVVNFARKYYTVYQKYLFFFLERSIFNPLALSGAFSSRV
jgi:hypothetical protein